jgi:hypothetical protein
MEKNDSQILSPLQAPLKPYAVEGLNMLEEG